jgi:hypothetical protein
MRREMRELQHQTRKEMRELQHQLRLDIYSMTCNTGRAKTPTECGVGSMKRDSICAN